MKFPIKKIILPDKSFSKLLLSDFKPTIVSYNKQKISSGWLFTKQYSGKIENSISYDIYTHAKYDYNRYEPNDTCNIKVTVYSKDYNYSVHERCKIVNNMNNYTDDINVYMNYAIFDNNKFNNNSFRNGTYDLPLDLYKILDVSHYFNDKIKNKYDYLNNIISKEK
jgi:hypothetical protein